MPAALVAGAGTGSTSVNPAGTMSVAITFWAGAGPRFVTFTVNVTVSPPAAVVGAPIMVTATSASSFRVDSSDAVLLAGFVSVSPAADVTVAVLVNGFT